MPSIVTVPLQLINRLLDFMAIITSVVLVSMVFFMVIARYVFEWSIIGLDEIALLAAMWLYMSGAIIASRNNEHLVVDFLPQRINSKKLLMLHQRFIALIMVAASGFFCYLAWDLLQFSLRLPQHTAGLKLPELLPKSALMVASVACLLYSLRDLITGNPCHNIRAEE
ncbi:TRAP transporter small permease [Halomonas marinisediminis]|uniref:TRAP transporter small permease protein n=1 Tax=Halomonas marinisediminis TaxID=2546095 RepID=A0ABY2D465_9GAMM|nr:TRAP transporter small permease subunit [Halomonas marinisediminis]TDB01187.1 TRAP transporter small permease subunit [Halomonas marinisediminis]